MSRYISLLQKPYCCAVTCLLMIIYRHTGRFYDQEELALRFGVRISPDVRDAFSVPMQILTAHNHDEGLKTLELSPPLENFFTEEEIPLRCHLKKYSQIANLESFIIEELSLDHDLWCEYVVGALSGSDFYLHDGLIESYQRETQMLTLMNPEPRSKNRKEIHLHEFEDRISGKYSRETGFLIIKKI